MRHFSQLLTKAASVSPSRFDKDLDRTDFRQPRGSRGPSKALLLSLQAVSWARRPLTQCLPASGMESAIFRYVLFLSCVIERHTHFGDPQNLKARLLRARKPFDA